MSISRRSFVGLLAAAGLGRLITTPAQAEPTTAPVPRRKFGKHDETVSVVGLGGHTLALAPSIEEATRIARHGIERGITFFDNAWDYHGGRAEEWMGQALADGWRDRAFIMTKVCTHGKPLPDGGKEGAVRMLEDSLRRLKTDRIDLWMIHQLENDDEVAKAYGPGGVIEALEEAKKQGKVRYTGFTGHTNPDSHLKMIEGGYDFDATLMPVSALGATLQKKDGGDILKSCQFVEKVLPALEKRRIAVLGMKGFGGSKRANLAGLVNADKVVRFSLGFPGVCTHMIGVDKFEYVDQAAVAASKTPMDSTEQAAFMLSCARAEGWHYAAYLEPGHRDGLSHTLA